MSGQGDGACDEEEWAADPTALPPCVFLMGPTGAGKTALAIELVQRMPFEIVSVDSAMVYRGMDVGTGKPSPESRRVAPHWLIDIRDPNETYSVAEFCADALVSIRRIYRGGKVPLLVGGSSLYFRALRDGLAKLPSADPRLRSNLNAEAERVGWGMLHARLRSVDPITAARVHPNDPQRIQRALEVFELTGQPLSVLVSRSAHAPLPFPVRCLALTRAARSELHQSIERRFDQMLRMGLIEEVERLRALPGLSRELPSMRAVGYRQVWDYLDARVDYPTMRATALVATRGLARRQLTWLRSRAGIRWLDGAAPRLLDDVLSLLRCDPSRSAGEW